MMRDRVADARAELLGEPRADRDLAAPGGSGARLPATILALIERCADVLLRVMPRTSTPSTRPLIARQQRLLDQRRRAITPGVVARFLERSAASCRAGRHSPG